MMLEFITKAVLSFSLSIYHQTALFLSRDPQLKLLSIFFGILLCFCGSSFGSLIVIVEAYRFIWGYDAMISNIRKICSDVNTFIRKNNEDNNVDADGDGISDVLLISQKELIVRKALLLMRSVRPETVSKAASNIPIGVLVIIGVLKMDIAKTIILGSSIGDIINVPYLVPMTMRVLGIPEDYRDWTSLGLQTVVKAIVLLLAWVMHPILFALHSALFGAMLCSNHLLSVVVPFLKKRWGATVRLENDSASHELVGYALAVLGLYFQLFGSSLAVRRLILRLIVFNKYFWYTLGVSGLAYMGLTYFNKVPVKEEEPPDEFMCPISREIMTDPVITAAGQTYERAAIEQWLAGHDTDPMAHIRINKTLTPNFALKQSIQRLLAKKQKP